MALIVQKFGGSSVKDRDRIFNVARIVANTHNAGNDVVVVVSAQGDTTDDLIAKAGEITHNPSAREMDMLLASGEQISIALLAMALNELGCHAKRKGQCRHKGFSAGKCPYFTLFSCHRGIHHQIKTSVFTLTGFFEIIHPKFKLSCRHFLKTSVRCI